MSDEKKSIGRVSTANQIVAGIGVGDKTTLGKLAKQVDDVVVVGGGKSNMPVAITAVRHALNMAESFGLMRLTKPTDTLVERIK